MNKLDQQYQTLLNNILEYGVEKSDRTGTGTQSIFGYTIRHNMSEGFPLITTKKMAIKTMMTELKWFLKGDTNIKYLVKNNCNIWNGDAYKNYLNTYKGNWVMNMKEFVESIKNSDDTAKMYGDLGPIYGKQWRRWETDSVSIDQIQNLINELKKNPDSRRLMVNAWNVSELGEMTLPPCHYGFQVYTRPTTREEKITNPGKYRAISLMWNQRSVDTGLGLPFNIASYGALLTLIGHEVNMIPDVLIGSFGDTHLYKDHLDGAREQMERVSFDLPTIEFTNVNLLEGEFDYEVKDYQYHPTIKFSLSN